MAYIRSNQDWYMANGDFRSSAERARDIEREIVRDDRMPDSIRERLAVEAAQNRLDADDN